jgi:hypothetical protein
MPVALTIEQYENSRHVQENLRRQMHEPFAQAPARLRLGHQGDVRRPQASPASQAAARAHEARAHRETVALNREIKRVVQNGGRLVVSPEEIQALRLTENELDVLRRPMPERGSGTQLFFYREAFAARKKVRDYRLHARAARNLLALGGPHRK